MSAFESVGCAHQLHAAGDGPTSVCVCPAGPVHMLDCPLTLGLSCVHFRPSAPPEVASAVRVEEARELLMRDYLTRAYHHRVRSLGGSGGEWHARREELAARYAAAEAEPETGETEEAYERERDRILDERRRREGARRKAEEQERAERARRMKTVVQRAQEAVAAREGEARLEPAPAGSEKPRRKRKRRPGRGGRKRRTGGGNA